MPNRLTVGDIRNSRIPASLGLCSTEPRLLQWLNEADEKLLHAGLWWSSYSKFRICASNGCITLPPQMAVIEQAAQCGVPIPVHDQWFEFLENGFGTRNPALASIAGSNASGCGSSGCGLPEADHRGFFPSFDDIHGGSTNTPKKLLFVCDVNDDVGSTVTAFGYDGNGNWIRTNPGGIWQDGETITLAQSAGTQSTKIFSSLTGIQFPAPRKGQVWLYEYDTVATTQRLIGQYQYGETRPWYARYYIPSIGTSTTPAPAGTCGQTMVEIIAKLDHLPLVLDSDIPVIQSEPALKFEMQALKKFEDGVSQGDFAEAMGFHTAALSALDAQLDHYLGQGRRMGMTIVGSSVGANDPVCNLL